MLASAIAELVLHDSTTTVGEETGEGLGGEDGERLGVVEGSGLAATEGREVGLAAAAGLAAGVVALETDELPHPASTSKAAIAIAFMSA
jgi:hypothetical protein